MRVFAWGRGNVLALLPDAGWERVWQGRDYVLVFKRLLSEGGRRVMIAEHRLTSMCTRVNFLGRFLVKKPALRFKFR